MASQRNAQHGYRHIDSAYLYLNEEEIGRAIQNKIANGIVKREDIFCTSKLWSTFLCPELVQTGLEISLRKLQLSYVDLFLIHFPAALKLGEEIFPKDTDGKTIFDTVDICATWETLEKCKEAELAKSIGVSNFNSKQLQKILNKPGLKYKPVCNQVRPINAPLTSPSSSAHLFLMSTSHQWPPLREGSRRRLLSCLQGLLLTVDGIYTNQAFALHFGNTLIKVNHSLVFAETEASLIHLVSPSGLSPPGRAFSACLPPGCPAPLPRWLPAPSQDLKPQVLLFILTS
ncbi:dihydrodiol dehydrogenase 3-like [Molossus nigricans]